MIRLFQFAPALGLPNASSFCLKVETYLRLAGLEYEVETVADPRKMPMGKLPVIEDGGKMIADSRLIVEHLERSYPPGLDAELSNSERALAHTIARTVEEHLYWVLLRVRWVEENGWNAIRPAFFDNLPPVIRALLAGHVRRKMIRDLQGHGIGRLAMPQVTALADGDLESLSSMLGKRPYFLGDKPTSVDAAVFGVVANLHRVNIESPVKEAVLRRQNLVEHSDRIMQGFFAQQ